MEARQHAHLFRQLVAKCGGVDEIVRNHACRLKASRLYQLCDANGGAYATVDAIADLEAYCGEPVYSRALVEARPARPDVAGVVDEACEISESAAHLQKTVRLAKGRGGLTLRERIKIEELLEALSDEMRALRVAADVDAAVTSGAGGRS